MTEATSAIDNLLLNFLHATNDAESNDRLADLVQTHADPVIRRLLRSKLQVNFYQAGNAANHQEADDVYGDVVAQLLIELRQFRRDPQAKPIKQFSGFVAKLTLNACYQHLRAKYPQRNNLKNRVRYLLTQQPGFALWVDAQNDLVAGYQQWQQRGLTKIRSEALQAMCDDPARVLRQSLPHANFQQMNPAELVAAIFNAAGHPLELDMLVSILAELWGVRDQVESLDEPKADDTNAPREVADPRANVSVEVANRMYLQQLWEEVCALPVRQRTALLLHLRDEQGNSVTPLLAHLGIVSIAQLAETLSLSPLEFARIWYDLPLDDNQIAVMLGLTRQQVINLRKSARERLARRLKNY